jgi:hypothetical protein
MTIGLDDWGVPVADEEITEAARLSAATEEPWREDGVGGGGVEEGGGAAAAAAAFRADLRSASSFFESTAEGMPKSTVNGDEVESFDRRRDARSSTASEDSARTAASERLNPPSPDSRRGPTHKTRWTWQGVEGIG